MMASLGLRGLVDHYGEVALRVSGGNNHQRGVHIYVYHADSVGWYARRGQKFNRIAGVLVTNERGEYRSRVLQFPHIHLTAIA